MMYYFFQMVDRLDDGTIPADLGPLDYKGLYKVIWVGQMFRSHKWYIDYLSSFLYHCHYFQAVGKALFWAHVEGRLKVNTVKLLYWLLWSYSVVLHSQQMTRNLCRARSCLSLNFLWSLIQNYLWRFWIRRRYYF